MLKISPVCLRRKYYQGKQLAFEKWFRFLPMVHPEKDWAFIALCDDESLWLYHGSWSRIENIPQTTDL